MRLRQNRSIARTNAAAKPRRIRIVADRIEMAAIGGAVEDVPDDGRDREHEERAPHDSGAANCDLIAHDLQSFLTC